MKRLLLTVCLGASIFTLNAQTKNFNASEEEDETPTFNYLKYRNSKFYETEDTYYRGQRIRSHQLREALRGTDAFDSWQLHKTFKGLTWGFGGVAIALLGVSIYQIVDSEGFDDGAVFRNAAIGVIVLGELPSVILTGVYGRKTARIYNEHIVHQKKRFSLNFGPARHGMGLTLKF